MPERGFAIEITALLFGWKFCLVGVSEGDGAHLLRAGRVHAQDAQVAPVGNVVAAVADKISALRAAAEAFPVPVFGGDVYFIGHAAGAIHLVQRGRVAVVAEAVIRIGLRTGGQSRALGYAIEAAHAAQAGHGRINHALFKGRLLAFVFLLGFWLIGRRFGSSSVIRVGLGLRAGGSK